MNRFKVLPEDEALASELHDFIVAHSKVLTILSIEGQDLASEGFYQEAQLVQGNLRNVQLELNKAYRDLAELRRKRIQSLDRKIQVTVEITHITGGHPL